MSQYRTKLRELQFSLMISASIVSVFSQYSHPPVDCEGEVAGADESVVPDYRLDAATLIQL